MLIVSTSASLFQTKSARGVLGVTSGLGVSSFPGIGDAVRAFSDVQVFDGGIVTKVYTFLCAHRAVRGISIYRGCG